MICFGCLGEEIIDETITPHGYHKTASTNRLKLITFLLQIENPQLNPSPPYYFFLVVLLPWFKQLVHIRRVINTNPPAENRVENKSRSSATLLFLAKPSTLDKTIQTTLCRIYNIPMVFRGMCLIDYSPMVAL